MMKGFLNNITETEPFPRDQSLVSEWLCSEDWFGGAPSYLHYEERFVDGPDTAIHQMGRGVVVFMRQGYHRYPFLRGLYPSEWENSFSCLEVNRLMRQHMWLPVVVCALYMALVVVAGPRWMHDRKPFQLRGALAAWNLFLSVFSLVGFIRVAPSTLGVIFQEGFEHSICGDAIEAGGLSGPFGLWTMLFCLSKFPELVDTVFIVLRKRKLIFLHWYHHITVLLFCWHAYAARASTGPQFVAMNYLVHSVMYYYYFAVALRVWPSFLSPMIITVLQLTQMALGGGICAAALRLRYAHGRKCSGVAEDNAVLGLLMYASYFMLFLHFMLRRFVLGARDPKKAPRPASAERPAAPLPPRAPRVGRCVGPPGATEAAVACGGAAAATAAVAAVTA